VVPVSSSIHAFLEGSFRQVFIVDSKININSEVNYHTICFELLGLPIAARSAVKGIAIKCRKYN
jgi:hypothetical protein